jgi:signal transduction histidine kinase
VIVTGLIPLSVGSVLVDGLPKGAGLPLASYAALGSFSIAVALFLVAGRVVNRFLPVGAPGRRVAVTVIYAASEIIRTILFALALERNGVDVDMVLHHRFVAGGLTGIVIIGLVSVVIHDRAQYASEFDQLTERNSELARELQNLTGAIDQLIDTLRETVRQSVDAALRPIVSRFETQHSVSRVVSDIVEVSERVVKPLSEDIHRTLLQPSERDTSVRRVRLGTLAGLTTLVSPFQPGVITVIVFLLMLSSSLFLVPFPDGIVILVGFLTVIGVSHVLGKRLLAPRLARWPIGWRFAAIAAVYASGPILLSLLLIVFESEPVDTEAWLRLVYFVLIVEFLSWGLAVVPALRRGQQDILDELLKTTSDLAQVRSRAEVRLRREKQRLASIVHGDIQSTLMATALKLQHRSTKSEDVTGILEQARQTIQHSLAVADEPAVALTLDDIRSALGNAWSGIVTLHWDAARGVKALLNQDSDLAETVWQVLREAVTNAVKHGSASSVTITLARDNTHHLRCTVKDNGKIRDPNGVPGGGSRLFHAVSEDVSIVRKSSQTHLTLLLPIAVPGEHVAARPLASIP